MKKIASVSQRLPARRRLRLLLGAALGLLLLGGWWGNASAAAPADTITLISPNNATVAESDDYATQVVGKPWDGSDAGEFSYLSYLTPPTSSNGIWSSQIAAHGPAIFVVYPGLAGPYNYLGAPTGLSYPIDPHRFSHLRVRLYTEVASQIVVLWIPPNTYSPSGNSNAVNTVVGWHIYDIDLTAVGQGAAGQPWASQSSWAGIRFDPISGPNNYAGHTLQIDWLRLTPSTSPAISIDWTAVGSSSVSLYLTTSSQGADEETIATGLAATAGHYSWSTAGLAPGTYYIHAVMGSASAYSGPLHINQAPVLNLTAPSPSSGEDFATTVLGAPWTLTSLSQLQDIQNVTNISFGPGYMKGTGQIVSGGHADPQLWFLQNDAAHAINTNRYHYASYRLYLAAPTNPTNGQYPQYNIGPREIWSRSDQGNITQSTQAYVAFYNRWLAVANDMRTTPESPGSHNTGWTGATTSFRFDPHEEDGAFGSGVTMPYFEIGQFRLTADPTVANGAKTIISWTPIKSNGTVTLYYNTQKAVGGTRIATGIPLSSGGYVWSVTGVPAGNYWISAQAVDGLNSFSQIALVQLTVTGQRPCPPTYSDVPSSQPFYTYIKNLSCAGIIDGYLNNTFLPYNFTSRATLVQWVVHTHNIPINTAGGPHFTDVPPSDPSYAYVETAYNAQIISGYNCGGAGEPCDAQNRLYFRPYGGLTRGQASKIIVNGLHLPINTNGGPHFGDVDAQNPFYAQIETLYNAGAISGYGDGTFKWGNPLTRGQLAKILDNARQ